MAGGKEQLPEDQKRQDMPNGCFDLLRYKPEIDERGREILLIVATLIAAVTFQAGVNPPGGIWQDNDNGHVAGRAIYASQRIAFYVFLVFNTFALSTSVLVIRCLTYRYPFHVQLSVATVSMMVTYASAIFAVTPHESVRFRYVLISGALPVICQCIIQMWGKVKDNSDSHKGKAPQNARW